MCIYFLIRKPSFIEITSSFRPILFLLSSCFFPDPTSPSNEFRSITSFCSWKLGLAMLSVEYPPVWSRIGSVLLDGTAVDGIEWLERSSSFRRPAGPTECGAIAQVIDLFDASRVIMWFRIRQKVKKRGKIKKEKKEKKKMGDGRLHSPGSPGLAAARLHLICRTFHDWIVDGAMRPPCSVSVQSREKNESASATTGTSAGVSERERERERDRETEREGKQLLVAPLWLWPRASSDLWRRWWSDDRQLNTEL